MANKRTNLMGLARVRVILVLVVVAGIIAAAGSGGTLAYFTSTATSTENTFTAGTVRLLVADDDDVAAASIDGSISGTNLKPGDTVYGYITVSNAGTLPFDYGLKYTATNGATALIAGTGTDPTLEVYSGVTSTNCAEGNVDGGTSEYGPTTLSTVANTTIFDSGDASKRSLDASGGANDEETLCLVVNWPNGAAGAENAQQGGSATIVFNFDARQQ